MSAVCMRCPITHGLGDAETVHLYPDVESVLDDFIAHMHLGLVLVGRHELIRVQVHVQANESVAQLEAWHKRVRREEAGRGIVCSTHSSLIFAGNGAMQSANTQ